MGGDAGYDSWWGGGKGDNWNAGAVATTVTIKGLPSNTTEDDLRRLFHKSTLGKVTICYSKDAQRCKGYAFADFSNLAEARQTVQTLNGVVVDGVRISLEIRNFLVDKVPA